MVNEKEKEDKDAKTGKENEIRGVKKRRNLPIALASALPLMLILRALRTKQAEYILKGASR